MNLLFNGFEGSNVEKMGRQQRKSFYSEIWGDAVSVGWACENPVGLTMCDGPMETVEYVSTCG